jgi:hypothetical protein
MRRNAMRRSKWVASKATKLSLEDVIAHLRDLDLKGLRARWKSVFRRQPPSHLPRHLLFAVYGGALLWRPVGAALSSRHVGEFAATIILG